MVYEGLIAGAAFALGSLSVGGLYLLRRWESTAGPASPARPSPRCARDESAVGGARVRGPEPPVQKPANDTDARPRVFVGAKFQVDDFVQMIIAEGFGGKYRDRHIVQAYRAWARERRIDMLREPALLAELARHPNVQRSRPRVKGADGKVLYLESGTPVRHTCYTINERPYAVVPTGVKPPRKPGVRGGSKESNARVQGRSKQPQRIAA